MLSVYLTYSLYFKRHRSINKNDKFKDYNLIAVDFTIKKDNL